MPGGSQGAETTAYCLIAFLASNAAAVLDGDRVVLDSPATVEALRFLRSLVEDGSMPADVVAYEWNRSTAMLAEGQVAISFGGSYEAAGHAEALGVPLAELWDHVGFVPAPAGPRGTPSCAAGTMSYGIFSQAAEPRVALDLLRLAVEPEALARHRALDWTHPGAAVSRAARRPRLPVPARDRRDARAGGDAPCDAVVRPRLGSAPVDARVGPDRVVEARPAAASKTAS